MANVAFLWLGFGGEGLSEQFTEGGDCRHKNIVYNFSVTFWTQVVNSGRQVSARIYDVFSHKENGHCNSNNFAIYIDVHNLLRMAYYAVALVCKFALNKRQTSIQPYPRAHSFILTLICASILALIHSFIHSCTHLCFHPYAHSFSLTLICPSIITLIHLASHSSLLSILIYLSSYILICLSTLMLIHLSSYSSVLPSFRSSIYPHTHLSFHLHAHPFILHSLGNLPQHSFNRPSLNLFIHSSSHSFDHPSLHTSIYPHSQLSAHLHHRRFSFIIIYPSILVTIY